MDHTQLTAWEFQCVNLFIQMSKEYVALHYVISVIKTKVFSTRAVNIVKSEKWQRQ